MRKGPSNSISDQAYFILGCDAGGEKGKALVRSVARIDPKVDLAEGSLD